MKNVNRAGNPDRDIALDLIKGLGILLVYLGHTFWAGSLWFRVIFFVHMPLFFLVSGILFDPMRYASFRDVFKKIAVGLLVPYFCFSAVGYALRWDFYFPRLQAHTAREMYCLFVNGDCVWALWFLVCLAAVKVIYYVAYRAGAERNARMRLVFACGFLMMAEGSMWFLRPYRRFVPLMLTSVPAPLFFFLIGRWVRPRLKSWLDILALPRFGWLALIVSVTLCFVSAMLLWTMGGFDLRTGKFTVAGLLPSFSGLIGLAAIASMLKGGWLVAIFKYLGEYSLVFFAMEQNASHIFTMIVRFCGYYAPEFYHRTNGLIGLKMGRVLFCLLVVALIAPMVDLAVRKVQKRVGILMP